MGISFEDEGKVETISFKEVAARLWPFGKWRVIWKHVLDGEHDGKSTTDKTGAINMFNQFDYSDYMKIVRIRKEGGFLNGIEYKPRTRKAKDI